MIYAQCTPWKQDYDASHSLSCINNQFSSWLGGVTLFLTNISTVGYFLFIPPRGLDLNCSSASSKSPYIREILMSILTPRIICHLSVQGQGTYKGKNMSSSFLVIISHMFVCKSHATIRKPTHKRFLLKVHSLLMNMKIRSLLMQNHVWWLNKR